MNSGTPTSDIYDVAILGGGVSGTGLLYTLAKYSTIERMVLLEKEDALGAVNSKASNNSQTLHVGDIETNYTVEKVRQVKPAAMMVVRYVRSLPEERTHGVLFPVQKMVLAVGAEECRVLTKRYDDLRALFPTLKKLDWEDIAKFEPAIVDGRNPREEILALANSEGYAVNFGRLAESFAAEAVVAAEGRAVDVLLGRTVGRIVRRDDGLFALTTSKGTIVAHTVVVDADAHSLTFAKAMGYGHEYSLIPIAGSFYFSAPKLKGKVYTMQEPKLPFAAVHGDPDILANGETRWGPTARFFPILESRKWNTVLEYLRTSGLNRLSTWLSFFSILLEPIRFFYLVRNTFYELPWIGIRLFAGSVRKIVPTIKPSDLRRADGFGGMRLQRVDVRTRELQLGEGKIVGDRILFNMTPSPGASVALYNGMRDAAFVVGALDRRFSFDEHRMRHDLFDDGQSPLTDTSVKDSYAS